VGHTLGTRLRTIALVALGLTLFLWSRGTWPDPLVDFGRELYVPWRLSLGEVLYRDIAWQDGPLSPLWNGLLFRIFGPGLSVLVCANLVVTVAVAWLLHRLLARAGGRGAADLAVVLFLCLFAFARYGGIGNYNYITPYHHGMTHGLLGALASLEFLERWARKGRPRAAQCVLAAGAALGLAFLAKPELFLAAALACAWRLASARRREQPRAPLGLFLAGLLAPPGLAFLYLWGQLSAPDALSGVLGGWPHLFGSDVIGLEFYRRGLGIDDVPGNLLRMGASAIVAGGAYGLAMLLPRARFLGGEARRHAWPAAAGLFALFFLPVALAGDGLPGHGLARSWPAFLLALCIWCGLRRRNAAAGERDREGARLALVLFAGVLLGKMVLNTRLHHYGFVLALPAAAVLAAAAFDWIPEARRARVGDRATFLTRAAVLGLVLSLVPWHMARADAWFERQTARVGTGRDAFLADGRGRLVRAALAEIERRTDAQDTVLVLPEGVMLNYLCRRATPTPHLNFMPPEMSFFGEEAVLAALRATPPDLVVLAHKDTSEYGFPLFGTDYGEKIMAWVRGRYTETWRAGARPLQSSAQGFGIAILEP
jgi:hypothetical protein